MDARAEGYKRVRSKPWDKGTQGWEREPYLRFRARYCGISLAVVADVRSGMTEVAVEVVLAAGMARSCTVKGLGKGKERERPQETFE